MASAPSVFERCCYLHVIIASAVILSSSCASKSLIRLPDSFGSYDISITKAGIEAVNYEDLSTQKWWELFYQNVASIHGSDLGYHYQFEYDAQLESLVVLIETKGEKFFVDGFGTIPYLELGSNAGPIANISYFRILDDQSLAASRRLDLLIEKGVEVNWTDLPKEMNRNDTVSEEHSLPWILYRFLISRKMDDQRRLISRSFLLSCDKYYCVTGRGGTRRVLLAEGKRRYGDLLLPENDGYETIDRIFEKAVEAYNAHHSSSSQ